MDVVFKSQQSDFLYGLTTHCINNFKPVENIEHCDCMQSGTSCDKFEHSFLEHIIVIYKENADLHYYIFR